MEEKQLKPVTLVDYGEDVPLLETSTNICNKNSHCLRKMMKGCLRFLFGLSANYKERFIQFRWDAPKQHFANNAVKNTKYNILTFLPLALADQFKFFYNIFYLAVCVSQLVPILQIGPTFTYLFPLLFVLLVALAKELVDDIKRYNRDTELNNTLYKKLTPEGSVNIASSSIKVGDVISIEANQRVPADLLFLRTTEEHGSTFIRTDQLDGETDWKLRRALNVTQNLHHIGQMFMLDCVCWIEAPRKDIYEFEGNATTTLGNGVVDGVADRSTTNSSVNVDRSLGKQIIEPITLENTMWANTVVASGKVYGLVIYTGKETRSAMNTNTASAKMGIFDSEVNTLSKILFSILLLASIILLLFKGFKGAWWIYLLRFILLLSSIIPISLRVNLDTAKVLYSINIMRDKSIPDTLVRSSTLPEELGRVDYLLTDKTGTLTQNDMTWKRLHLGRASFGTDDVPKLREIISRQNQRSDDILEGDGSGRSKYELKEFSSSKAELLSLVNRTVQALSLCHNVNALHNGSDIIYQAASPDEIALVHFADSAGMRLVYRDELMITLQLPNGDRNHYTILRCFPFSSELKRMGIIVRDEAANKILFLVKGAESTMIPLLQVRGSNWLQEECDNFARQGLRTLVVAYKEFTEAQWEEFQTRYNLAATALVDRRARCQREVDKIEKDLILLGLTGVEDKLNPDVPQTLQSLQNAGIKIWMLTGDKVETATCVAVSAGLKAKRHSTYTITASDIRTMADADELLQKFAMGPTETVLIIDGGGLEYYLKHLPSSFILIASQAPAVVCCRCSPTQKADVVMNIKKFTKRRTCAIGDGGNDVSMIQSADVGIGLVGKEGKQASLAADFALTQFCHLQRLLLWHGRNCYQRSAKLAQFVIHRGLIIAVIQIMFCSIFFFLPIAIFRGWLVVGYSTYYTMAPVFSLVLDVELPEKVVFMYPELYQKLKTGRNMSAKTFFVWCWVSVYQGAIVMIFALALFEESLINIIDIAFSALVLSELLNVASEINTWHPLMVASEVCTVVVYIYTMFVFRDYFDISFILTVRFWWRVLLITLISWLPIHLMNLLLRIIRPPQYTKLSVIE